MTGWLLVACVAAVLGAGATWDAWREPWKFCPCAGRKCRRCRFVGKRPKLLARVVRRQHLRDEGWLK